MKIARVLVVHKKSVYRLYIEEHRVAGVQTAIRRGDAEARRLIQDHHRQLAALEQSQHLLSRMGLEVVVRWRARVRTTRGFDLIIALGGDGTLLDTAHRILDDTPLMGINSNPQVSTGALCAGDTRSLPSIVSQLQRGRRRPRLVTRIQTTVDGREVLGPSLNDILFAHPSPAELSRYEFRSLNPRGKATVFRSQRSSGIWIATGCGSTGAIRSAGGRALARGSARLQYLVREPCIPPHQRRARSPMVGFVAPRGRLELINRMRRGMLWSDGPHRRVAVDYGQSVVLTVHPVALRLVV